MWKATFEYAVSVRLKRFEFSTIHLFPPMKRTDASFKFCSIYEYDVVTNQTLETFAAMCMCFATSCDVRQLFALQQNPVGDEPISTSSMC